MPKFKSNYRVFLTIGVPIFEVLLYVAEIDTTKPVSRFNTVQHGSSRISKDVHGAATVVTRFITVHPGSSNRDKPAP